MDSAEPLARTYSVLGGVPYSKTWYITPELSVPDAKKPFGTFEFICHELPAGKTTSPLVLLLCCTPPGGWRFPHDCVLANQSAVEESQCLPPDSADDRITSTTCH